MKINRLLETTIILLNKGHSTTKELAERFGVSRRTILRDVEVLSSAGVPVYTNKGNGGGIALLEDYSLNKTIMSANEAEGLLLALKTLQTTSYPEADMLLDKMGALFKHASAADWVSIDFSPWGSKPNEQNKFTNIKKAILERRVVVFDYISSEGSKSYRRIEPLQLSYKGQAWYLVGFCLVRQDFRVFRISRVKNLEVTEDTYERRDYTNFSVEKQIENERSEVRIRLRFQPEVLYRVYDGFMDEILARNEDGTCEVELHMLEDEWIYGFILSFGCYVEVLEPEHIRTIVKDRMKKALQYYNK